MNVYDFDKTIYYGDSTADFYLFCLKRHKKILTLAPSLLGAFLKFYVFKKGTKTDFKEKMYRFLTYCDTEKDVNDFWKEYIGNIKPFYLKQKKDDDVIIATIFPNMEEIESRLGSSPSEDKIQELLEEAVEEVNEKLVHYKRVKSVVYRPTEFEKNTSRKIKRY